MKLRDFDKILMGCTALLALGFGGCAQAVYMENSPPQNSTDYSKLKNKEGAEDRGVIFPFEPDKSGRGLHQYVPVGPIKVTVKKIVTSSIIEVGNKFYTTQVRLIDFTPLDFLKLENWMERNLLDVELTFMGTKNQDGELIACLWSDKYVRDVLIEKKIAAFKQPTNVTLCKGYNDAKKELPIWKTIPYEVNHHFIEASVQGEELDKFLAEIVYFPNINYVEVRFNTESEFNRHIYIPNITPLHYGQRGEENLLNYLRQNFVGKGAVVLKSKSFSAKDKYELIIDGVEFLEVLRGKGVVRAKKSQHLDTDILPSYLPIILENIIILKYNGDNNFTVTHEGLSYPLDITLTDVIPFHSSISIVREFYNRELVGSQVDFIGTRDKDGNIIGCLPSERDKISKYLINRKLASAIEDSRVPLCYRSERE